MDWMEGISATLTMNYQDELPESGLVHDSLLLLPSFG